MIKKIDHLGIAVPSIEEARIFYEKVLGLVCEKIETVAAQKVKTAFYKIGDIHIELLEPTGPDSPVARFLEKKGPGFHHIGYMTDDINHSLETASENSCQLINETPVAGAGGKEIAFLHPKSTHGVLTEFCTASKDGSHEK